MPNSLLHHPSASHSASHSASLLDQLLTSPLHSLTRPKSLSTVFLTSLNSHAVVLKLPSTPTSLSFHLLIHETSLYVHIQTTTTLLGTILPRLLAYGAPDDPFLVLDYVGETVRIRKGELSIGDAKLEKGDVQILLDFAVGALRELHNRAGVLHGDVNVRNLRGRKEEGRAIRVWWVDLGMAKRAVGKGQGEREVEEFVRRFWAQLGE